jgi:hypothetical protein
MGWFNKVASGFKKLINKAKDFIFNKPHENLDWGDDDDRIDDSNSQEGKPNLMFNGINTGLTEWTNAPVEKVNSAGVGYGIWVEGFDYMGAYHAWFIAYGGQFYENHVAIPNPAYDNPVENDFDKAWREFTEWGEAENAKAEIYSDDDDD